MYGPQTTSGPSARGLSSTKASLSDTYGNGSFAPVITRVNKQQATSSGNGSGLPDQRKAAITISQVSAERLANDGISLSTYTSVRVGTVALETTIQTDTVNPRWPEVFPFVMGRLDTLYLTVCDEERVSNVGEAWLTPDDLLARVSMDLGGKAGRVTVPLDGPDGVAGTLSFRLTGLDEIANLCQTPRPEQGGGGPRWPGRTACGSRCA